MTYVLAKQTKYRPRYSNAKIDMSLFQQIEGSNDYSNIGTGTGLNYNSLINKLFGTTENVLVAIFGKGDKYRALALQEINEQQQKTTYVLWAVIGILLVMGIILILRKK